jgi:hypothetical protein
MKKEKFVIRSEESKKYGNHEEYSRGVAVYQRGLINAKIFTEKEIPEFMKKDPSRYEIISLKSEKGLELMFNEMKKLDSQIPEMERRLNEMKKGRENLYNANPEMISEIIERYNRNTSGGLIQVSSETEKQIIKKSCE